jgi:hypothetical protein
MSEPTTAEGLPDGVALLQQAKKRAPATRRIEPPRKPSNRAPYVSPNSAGSDDAHGDQDKRVIDVTETATEAIPEKSSDKPARPPKRTPSEPEAQMRLTVYVEEAHDTFMDDVRFAGARRRPKVDVSRSAIVRFALERLKSDMTPEELCNTIADRPVDPKATGRKRR